MEKDNRPMYRGDSYPDWDSRDPQAIAREEAEKQLNNELSKEYKDLFVPHEEKADALFNKDSDGVDRSHYRTAEFEPIEIIEEYKLNFNLGNAIKYILRAPYKNQETSDLKKALWYIQRELANGNKS